MNIFTDHLLRTNVVLLLWTTVVVQIEQSLLCVCVSMSPENNF